MARNDQDTFEEFRRRGGRRRRNRRDNENTRNDRNDRNDRGGGKKRGGGGNSQSASGGGNNQTTSTSTGNLGGANLQGLVQDTPTALINTVLGQLGLNTTGGLGDTLSQIATPDQIDRVVALLAARGGSFGKDVSGQAADIQNFYRTLATGGGGGVPSMQSLLAPAFANGAMNADNPYYGMFGGTPAEQLSQMIGAVSDLSQVSGANNLNRRALMASLNALGRDYAATQGVAGANQTFIDYLKQRAPQLAAYLGNGQSSGTPITNPPPVSTNQGGGQQVENGIPLRDRDRGGGHHGNRRDRNNNGIPDRREGRGQNETRPDGVGDAGARPGQGAGANLGVTADPITQPNKFRHQVQNATRQARRQNNRDNRRSRANASAGSVQTGNISPNANVTINADAGKAVDRSGRASAANATMSTNAVVPEGAVPQGTRQPTGSESPAQRMSFTSYANQNSPYTRPAPSVDVPGYRAATDAFNQQQTAALDTRNQQYSAAQSAWQQQMDQYNQQVAGTQPMFSEWIRRRQPQAGYGGSVY